MITAFTYYRFKPADRMLYLWTVIADVAMVEFVGRLYFGAN